jgi:hypothetical protein
VNVAADGRVLKRRQPLVPAPRRRAAAARTAPEQAAEAAIT